MAGLGRKVFTPGEVLTATNVQNYLMDQAVQVYAGTAARGSAIGSATTEGMVSYLADVDTVQVATGTATWSALAYQSTVSAIPRVGLVPMVPTGISQSGGSASYDSTTGLITFTGSTVLRVDGVFNSTYSKYRIVFNARNVGATGNYSIQARFSAATTTSNVNYDNATVGFLASTSSSQHLGGLNLTQIYFARNWDSGVEVMTTMDIGNPAIAQNTTWTGTSISSYPSDLQYIISGGVHRVATAYDGFYWSSNNSTGTMKIYGYN